MQDEAEDLTPKSTMVMELCDTEDHAHISSIERCETLDEF